MSSTVTVAAHESVTPSLSITVSVTVFGPILLQSNALISIDKVTGPSASLLPPSTSAATIVAFPEASNCTVMFWHTAVGGVLQLPNSKFSINSAALLAASISILPIGVSVITPKKISALLLVANVNVSVKTPLESYTRKSVLSAKPKISIPTECIVESVKVITVNLWNSLAPTALSVAPPAPIPNAAILPEDAVTIKPGKISSAG